MSYEVQFPHFPSWLYRHKPLILLLAVSQSGRMQTRPMEPLNPSDYSPYPSLKTLLALTLVANYSTGHNGAGRLPANFRHITNCDVMQRYMKHNRGTR
jgi:hypothetical protein